MAALIFDNDLGKISNVLTFDPGANPLTISGTQGISISSGTTAQRPGSPQNGMIRNDTDYGGLPMMYANGSWQPLSSPGSRGYNSFFDDFIIDNAVVSTPFSQGWTPTITGTGTAVNGISSVLSSANNNLGVVQLSTGTTATGIAGAYTSLGDILLGYGVYYGEWRVSIPILSTGLQQFVFYVGLLDTVSAAGDQGDAVYFEYRQGTDTHWRIASSFATVRTKTNTTVTVNAGQWYKLGLLINAAANLVTYYIDGVSVGTINTNIPNTTLDTVGHGFKLEKNAGTTSRSAYVDYASLYYSMTTVR